VRALIEFHVITHLHLHYYNIRMQSPLAPICGMAAQKASWTLWSVVLFVHSVPAVISVQVQTDELHMLNSSMIASMSGSSDSMTTTLQWSSVHDPTSPDRTDCGPYNNDICLKNSPSWGGQYTCANSSQFCVSWAKDMQRCCSFTCRTAYLTEAACNAAMTSAMTSTGTCKYPHSGSSDCGGTAPPPDPTAPDTVGSIPDTVGAMSSAMPDTTGETSAAAAAPPPEPTMSSAMPGELGTMNTAAGGAAPMSGSFGAAQGQGGGAAQGGASATGDPHLTNLHGEKFDLMKPGRHLLIQIPRKRSESTLLRVDAGVSSLGAQCADMYFQELNITGAWADVKCAGGFHYRAQDVDDKPSHWAHFATVLLKVAHGRTHEGINYLNIYVRHLKHAGFAVGGLLGDDDHTEAATPPEECAHRLAL